MLIPAHVVPALLQLGIAIHPTGPDTVELTHPDGVSPSVGLAVQRRSAALSPSHLQRQPVPGRVLLVVPSASPAALGDAERVGVSVLTTGPSDTPTLGGHIVFPTGTVSLGLPVDRNATPPLRRGRRPWGMFAVLRQVLAGISANQVEMAEQAGISQGRVSQSLGQAAELGLVRRAHTRGQVHWVPTDWDELASWWTDHYPGPGGLTTYWFGLGDVVQQARGAVEHLESTGTRAAISGDVAADVLAPWRRPGRAVVYADVQAGSRGAHLGAVGLTPSGPEEATLELVVPEDRSVWGRPAAGVPLADGMQILWDVARSSGSDTDQALFALRGVLRRSAPDDGCA